MDVPATHYGIRAHGAEMAAEPGADDELLTPMEMAQWLKKSLQWLEFARSKGFGPPFIRIGRNVRYRRQDVREWLLEQTVTPGEAA